MPNSNPSQRPETPRPETPRPETLPPKFGLRTERKALLVGVALGCVIVSTSALSACDPVPSRAPTVAAAAPTTPSAQKSSRTPAQQSGLTRSASISVDELLEFLRIATGKPIIRVATPSIQRGSAPTPLTTGAPIAVVPSDAPLTVPVAKILLAANGIAVTPFLLDGEVSVLLVREDPKALAQLGTPLRTPLRTQSAAQKVAARPQMAHVDESWSIEPGSRGWIILDVQHASTASLERAIDRMIDVRALRVMEIGSHGQLLLDGPGEALTRAVELVRFLDKPEIWSEAEAPVRTTSQAPSSKAPSSKAPSRRGRSSRAATPRDDGRKSKESHTRQLRPRTRAAREATPPPPTPTAPTSAAPTSAAPAPKAATPATPTDRAPAPDAPASNAPTPEVTPEASPRAVEDSRVLTRG